MDFDFTALLLLQLLALSFLVILTLKGSFKENWGVLIFIVALLTVFANSGIDIGDLIAPAFSFLSRLNISDHLNLNTLGADTCKPVVGAGLGLGLVMLVWLLSSTVKPTDKQRKQEKSNKRFDEFRKTALKPIAIRPCNNATVCPATCEFANHANRLATYNSRAFREWQTSPFLLAASGFSFDDEKWVVICYRCHREMSREDADQPQSTWHHHWCPYAPPRQPDYDLSSGGRALSRRSSTQATVDDDQIIYPIRLTPDRMFPGSQANVNPDESLAISEDVDRRGATSRVESEQDDDDRRVHISDDGNINIYNRVTIRRPANSRTLDENRFDQERPGYNDETGLPLVIGGAPASDDDAQSDQEDFQ